MQAVRDLMQADNEEAAFRAVVTGTVGNLVTIRRNTLIPTDTQSYPRLESYTAPAAGHEVIMLRVGGGFICLGKISR